MRNNGRFFCFQCIALLLVFFVSTAATASAQTAPVDDRKLNLSMAADASLAQLNRRSDSLLNGALIGAGAGVATWLFVCTRMEPWRVCRDDFGPMAKFGALGAGIGIAVDALIRRSSPSINTPASRVQATPIVGRRAGGLYFAVNF